MKTSANNIGVKLYKDEKGILIKEYTLESWKADRTALDKEGKIKFTNNKGEITHFEYLSTEEKIKINLEKEILFEKYKEFTINKFIEGFKYYYSKSQNPKKYLILIKTQLDLFEPKHIERFLLYSEENKGLDFSIQMPSYYHYEHKGIRDMVGKQNYKWSKIFQFYLDSEIYGNVYTHHHIDMTAKYQWLKQEEKLKLDLFGIIALKKFIGIKNQIEIVHISFKSKLTDEIINKKLDDLYFKLSKYDYLDKSVELKEFKDCLLLNWNTHSSKIKWQCSIKDAVYVIDNILAYLFWNFGDKWIEESNKFYSDNNKLLKSRTIQTARNKNKNIQPSKALQTNKIKSEILG